MNTALTVIICHRNQACNRTWSLHSELFTLQYETTQGEKGPVVRPIILTARFIERKVRDIGGMLLTFFLVIPAIPFALKLTPGSRVSLRFVV